MYCTKCGNEMADEALFCPYCGTRRFPPPAPRGKCGVLADKVRRIREVAVQ